MNDQNREVESLKKVLFISHIGYRKNASPNGVNVKNRHILKYLNDMEGIQVRVIDTDNWKFKIVPLLFKIMWFSRMSDKIVLSINTMSAYRVIQFLYLLKLDKKLIYFVVGGNMHGWMRIGKLKAKYYTNISNIFVQTSEMKSTLNELGLRNVQQLSNSKYFDELELEYDKRIMEGPIRCFYIGRIHPDKGINLIFESFEMINNGQIKYIIDFYGPIEKKYSEEFLNKVKQYEYTNYRGVLDLIDHTENYYLLSKYDLFIFPTYWPGEGFPGAVLDSFISGVPVLASDWNHNREVIQDGYNGIIFAAKSREALIEALNHIQANKSMLADMGKNAQECSKKYKTSNVLKALEGLI